MLDCDPGFDDCNFDDADGCEASLSAPGSCGECRVLCSGTTPLCQGDRDSGYACVPSCTAGTEDCGGSCVDRWS